MEAFGYVQQKGDARVKNVSQAQECFVLNRWIYTLACCFALVWVSVWLTGCLRGGELRRAAPKAHPLERSYVALAKKAQRRSDVGKERRAWRDLLRSFPDSQFRGEAFARLRALREQAARSRPVMAPSVRAQVAARPLAKEPPKAPQNRPPAVRQSLPRKAVAAASGAVSPEPQRKQAPVDEKVIGVIVPDTGRGAALGRHIRRAVGMARAGFSDVRVVFVNSQSLPERAAQAVDDLIDQHQAIAILGPPLRKSAVSAAKRAQKRGVPFISITTKPGFARLGSYIFRNNVTLPGVGRMMARYAYRVLGLRTFGIFSPKQRFGSEQAAAFQHEIEQLGGKVVRHVQFSPKSRNLRPALRRLLGKRYGNQRELRVPWKQMRKMKPYMRRRLRKKLRHMLRPLPPFEGLFVPDDARVSSQIAAYLTLLNVPLRHPKGRSVTKHLRDGYVGYKKIVMLGNHSWYSKALFKSGKQYPKGSTFCVRFAQKSKRGRDFVRRYRREYREKPTHVDAYSYDAARVLLSISHRGTPSRASFRDAMLQLKRFQGPTGPFRFDKHGHARSPFRCYIAGAGYFYGQSRYRLEPLKPTP